MLWYIIPAILNIILLVWWRYNTEWTYDYIKFPSRGHIILLFLTGFIPVWGIVQFIILAIVYGVHRLNCYIELKETKFNKFWFDIDIND